MDPAITDLRDPTVLDSSTSNHFLSLPRPDVTNGPLLAGVPDTSTLAAHDFDVDTRTGFMPPDPPLERLPVEWELWEQLLRGAIEHRLQLGSNPYLSEEERAKSYAWRESVNLLPVLSAERLNVSERLLRRGHHVLAWVMHFYIHSLPPDEDVRIPRGVTIPLLHICNQLQLPPVLTYSDDVLYNWALKSPTPTSPGQFHTAPALDNLCTQTLFTGTKDEEEFYLVSARIELRGVQVLESMRRIMDEAFVGDDIALRRIASYLRSVATVIEELSSILLGVREGCDPEVFYNSVRPWFNGQDSDRKGRVWIFEGVEEDPRLVAPRELSGPSAGQSSLIHALDVFLGIEHGSSPSSKAWFDRMRNYMPRYHRNFLRHLSSNPRPLRALVESSGDPALCDAYNNAVGALKVFRDAHVKLVALYIVGPAGKVASDCGTIMRGTGGTDLMKFVKGTRDRTANSVMSQLKS